VPITSGGSAILDKLIGATAKDVLIGIGFFRPHRELIVAFDIADKLGIPRIAITDSESSPVAERASVVLRAKRGPADIMTSLAAPMTIANILTVAVANKNKEEAIDTFSKLDNMKETYNL
jgi:DNA-binding MurR/RpiR family transcriptional regulator